MHPAAGSCSRPPRGWYCTLAEGHDGPCPTRRVTELVPSETLIAFVTAGGLFSADTGEAFMRNTLALRLGNETRVPDRGELFEAMAAMLMSDPS